MAQILNITAPCVCCGSEPPPCPGWPARDLCVTVVSNFAPINGQKIPLVFRRERPEICITFGGVDHATYLHHPAAPPLMTPYYGAGLFGVPTCIEAGNLINISCDDGGVGFPVLNILAAITNDNPMRHPLPRPAEHCGGHVPVIVDSTSPFVAHTDPIGWDCEAFATFDIPKNYPCVGGVADASFCPTGGPSPMATQFLIAEGPC